MDFREERLSIISILLISGICCLVFTGALLVLEGDVHSFFLRGGIVLTSASVILFVLKRILLYFAARQKTRQSH